MSMILINQDFSPETIEVLCNYLRRGYVLLIKTDTQWGLMSADPMKIYSIKRRPEGKKIVRLVGPNFKFLDLSFQQKMFISKFWPGAVTIIKGGEAYRLANNNFINAILLSVGRIIYCSSANISGADPIHTIDEAISVFNHAANDIVGVIPQLAEDREWSDSLPSTIVDIDYWYIVRKGLKYEEVLDFIANTIIPSYKEISDDIHKKRNEILNKYSKYQPPSFYEGIPLIGVNPKRDREIINKIRKNSTYEDYKIAQEASKKMWKKEKIDRRLKAKANKNKEIKKK